MTRSTTSSIVLADCCGGAGAAEATSAPSPLKIRTGRIDRWMVHVNLHIFLLSSVSHAEFYPHTGRKIDRLIILFRRLEFNLLRRTDGGFVQAMAQAADHVVYMHGAVSQENQINYNVTF